MTDVNDIIDKIHCSDNISFLSDLPPNCVDIVVSSPPYGSLRDYHGFNFNMEQCRVLSRELYRVLKKGGVIVWVIGDETRSDGGESGTSFRQALLFQETGFIIYDTMIYLKSSFANPSHNKYHQAFEYMFVFSKGRPNTFNAINDRRNLCTRSGRASVRQKDGSLVRGKSVKYGKYGTRFNVWRYAIGKGCSSSDEIAFQHPAIFPEKLARDHIYSWSNEGDVVLDPFVGSGTTTKMAYLMYRKFIGVDCSEEYCDIARKRIKLHERERKHNKYWDFILNPGKNRGPTIMDFSR